MKKMVETTIGGERAVVSFVSRYRDQNDYTVYRAGKEGRVSRTDDGVIASRSEHFTDDEARAAVEAYRAHEAAEFARWQAQYAK